MSDDKSACAECGHGTHKKACGYREWLHGAGWTSACGCPAPAPDKSACEAVHEQFAVYQRESEFAEKLCSAINQCSQENGSNTPDFILACYLVRCLEAFSEASRARENWYGKSLHI